MFWPLRADGQPSASSPIYSIADLRATRRWLAEKETIVAVPGDVPHIVATTDIETQFDDSAAFHIEDDDMAEATLAWIVAMDIARGAAADWRIPPPHDTYLAELTGSADSDDAACPGTRQGARSVMIVPVVGDDRGWRLPDGTPMPRDGQRPDRESVRRVFSAAIPVSYPNPAAHANRVPRDWYGRRTRWQAAVRPATSGTPEQRPFRRDKCGGLHRSLP